MKDFYLYIYTKEDFFKKLLVWVIGFGFLFLILSGIFIAITDATGQYYGGGVLAVSGSISFLIASYIQSALRWIMNRRENKPDQLQKELEEYLEKKKNKKNKKEKENNDVLGEEVKQEVKQEKKEIEVIVDKNNELSNRDELVEEYGEEKVEKIENELKEKQNDNK